MYGVQVHWERRDINQASDAEMLLIDAIVRGETTRSHGNVTDITIESDYPDKDNVRYTVTTDVVYQPADCDSDSE